MDKLAEMFGGTVNEELFEQKFGQMQVILFGEGYGPRIQKGGGKYRDDASFILFDVYLPQKNLWMKRDAVEDIAKTFGIDVPDRIHCDHPRKFRYSCRQSFPCQSTGYP